MESNLKILKNNKGVALLITLTVITILVASALELNRRVRRTVESTATVRDNFTMQCIASSGIDIAKLILIKDKMDSKIDSLQEDWSNPEKIIKFLGEFPFDNGKLDLVILDEMARIQINALVTYPGGKDFNPAQKQLWDKFMINAASQIENLDEIEAIGIINSIKDWIDTGDDEMITGMNGAESDYYMELDTPYSCKNAPFTHLGELMLVKGITKELFESAGGMQGLSNYITIYGALEVGQNKFTFPGKININTADLPVLAALMPIESMELALVIYSYRQETEGVDYIHDLSNILWYKNVPGCGEIEIDPNLLSVSSDFFRIIATASINDKSLTINSVVQRVIDKKIKKWTCIVLSWEIE
ncbi:MAG: type II secretion system minor pseudopilin GspK [Desulfobacterales bacterium]|nr:type II secretion system minor pseudopilin GspK [Desulfobacterales bacterium]